MSNPLDILGVSQIRRAGVSFPYRYKVRFDNCALTDHPKKTIVGPGQTFTLSGVLGASAPPTDSDVGEGGTDYFYDERGGTWFGVDPSFSSADVIYMTTDIEAGDSIRVQGFAPDPTSPRKTLVNLGPGAITIGGRAGDSGNGWVRAAADLVLQPNDAARIFWDADAEAWRVIQRMGWRTDLMPEGQIVIQGHPLQIQGHPLVITPPAAARMRARETPAIAPADSASLPLAPKPEVVEATIIERPQPLPAAARPRALPTPLSGEPIELVDAFADASLEMDAEGDQFRVALAVQGAIEDLQAQVAELRFPFTLRTTSLDGTSYEEIGLLRFDASAFGAAFTIVAELEVAVAGQSAEFQLYDLTAAAVVATLSSSSTVTEKKSASVTLPLAEHLYSARLRRSGGASGQLVSCRSVTFER